MRILVSPIAFNEEKKINSVISRFLDSTARTKVDYCVMDDGSTDDTSKVIASYVEQGVTTLRHSKQSGVGAAIRTMIDFARQQQYDVLVIMAGNDKDDPNEIFKLTEPLIDGECDFVQGSRYYGQSGAGGDMPFYRRIATKLHPMMMSFITGKKVTDSTNGFRAFRLSLLDDPAINLHQAWLDQYELEPYLLYQVLKGQHRFKEVFVSKIYPPKHLGYTKMKPIVGWWSILRPLFYLWLGIKK